MVKCLSCGTFAAVKFYSGKLYQGDLRLHVNLFNTVDSCFNSIIFPIQALDDKQTSLSTGAL